MLAAAANTVGASLLQGSAGFDVLNQPAKAVMLLGVEADGDAYNPAKSLANLADAEMVAVMSAFMPSDSFSCC